MIPRLYNPSNMKKDFSTVPTAEISRSNFNRSHGHTTTFDGGYLIPILVDEVLPGDTFQLRMSAICRMITPVVPIMDTIHLSFFFFFDPYRLVWEHWRELCGQHDAAGAQDVDYTVPYVTAPVGGFSNMSIYDYMGIPTLVADFNANALALRSYSHIWNEWFRDQNLQDGVSVPIDDGPDLDTDFELLKRNKRHDYFTSCLPYPQKGDAVDLPLGTTAPIEYESGLSTAGKIRLASTDGLQTNNVALTVSTGSTGELWSNNVDSYYDPDGTLYADLSAADAVTINAFREAIQLQRMLERDSRSGSRYPEIIKAHFGINAAGGDARYQRPEYLGGGEMIINVQPVTNNSATTDYVGDLGATAYGTSSGIGFSKSFTEHGSIIGLCCAWADLRYQSGLRKMWSRQTRYDFYWPALAHLGEQEVLNREIYTQGTSADDDVFGYQERWAEYRYFPSLITGKLRSNGPINLDVWHLAQDFGSLPTLNSDFIEENPPFDRVVQVPSEPHFKADFWFDYICTRPIPTRSVPGYVDHF